MVRPVGRVLAMLEILQAGGTHTVAELARRVVVDERTARRYVQHLRELDIAVETVRGRYGGYRLARHSRLPPLMFTDEEALAVVWALLADRRDTVGPTSELAVQSASAKVRRVLPAGLARRIDAVLDTVSFTPAPDRDRYEEQDGSARATVLLALAEAARDLRPVSFGYTARRAAATQRHVEPYGIVAHQGRLYLSGFDVTRQAVRTFRLDRIAGVRTLEGTVSAPVDTDPVHHVLGPFAPAPQLHEVALRVHAEPAHVRSWLPETMASATPVDAAGGESGWLRVFLRADRLEWVVGTLVAMDRPFVVEYPEALRDLAAGLASRTAEVAAAASDDAAITAWSGDPGATRTPSSRAPGSTATPSSRTPS
ncbi:WYL domain-containing protein [Actinomycetospora corticicola]|uniref:Putative DNA-binding transcriptional regulator YafY n=1 Tax=Actinomycetospora corticicola TaxID=663602 RepID=A0A7Y9DXY5_9PSEU|nr:YafY family protein [Actinomycetospora corticicola]NYD37557.1 putative DNA-binding transcriptional regulator YafY [Actinomycetospora corticicola]